MELREYLSALRRFWATWVGLTVAGVVTALAVVWQTPPTYEATAQVFVASTTDGTSGSQFVNQRVRSYPDVAVSLAVLSPVIEQLKLERSFASLRESVTATNPVDTSQIDITVRSTSATLAADLANAVAEEFGTVVELLETPDSGTSPVNLTVTDPAIAPAGPVAPVPSLLLGLGLVVGLGLGLAVAVLRSRLDTAVHSADDVLRVWRADDEDAEDLTVLVEGGRRDGSAARPATVLARMIEGLTEPGGVTVAVIPSLPGAGPAAEQFAEDVAGTLAAWGLLMPAGHDPADAPATTGATPATPRAGVRLIRSDLSASPEEWRHVAATHDLAVLVAETGAMKAAELRELTFVLATAGIRPCAVVLLRRRSWPLRARTTNPRRPRSAVDAGDGAAAPRTPTAAPAGGGGGGARIEPRRPVPSSDDRPRSVLSGASVPSTRPRTADVPAEGVQR